MRLLPRLEIAGRLVAHRRQLLGGQCQEPLIALLQRLRRQRLERVAELALGVVEQAPLLGEVALQLARRGLVLDAPGVGVAQRPLQLSGARARLGDLLAQRRRGRLGGAGPARRRQPPDHSAQGSPDQRTRDNQNRLHVAAILSTCSGRHKKPVPIFIYF